jgi:retron-type reverse transcriptase
MPELLKFLIQHQGYIKILLKILKTNHNRNTRKRCWRCDWVFNFDIKAFFDEIDHELLMRAVHKHTDNKWLLLYIERLLKASMQAEDGTLYSRGKGSPQGSVINPLFANPNESQMSLNYRYLCSI